MCQLALKTNIISMQCLETISLDLADQSYDIQVGLGIRDNLIELLAPWNQGQQWVVLTQQSIYQLYASVVDQLRDSGYTIDVIIVPGDESAKNIQYAEQIWTQMVEFGCDRSSTLIAFGGGVVGDLGGFVAASYMRGIAYVQVPTTLLAMIDSAIGGKTAINLAAGKNLVGAVYQPKTVLVDPGFLTTLPERNLVSSLGEAVKYGFIRDRSIFTTIDQKFDDVIAMDQNLLNDLIVKSCKIKAQIVSNDQFELGERKLLNFGHTIGHALETLQGFTGLYHGEAVLYGMKCANYISHKKGLLNKADYEQAQSLLERFSLPKLGSNSDADVLKIVAHDKKNINGTLSFILLDSIGNAVINTEVSEAEIADSLSVL